MPRRKKESPEQVSEQPISEAPEKRRRSKKSAEQPNPPSQEPKPKGRRSKPREKKVETAAVSFVFRPVAESEAPAPAEKPRRERRERRKPDRSKPERAERPRPVRTKARVELSPARVPIPPKPQRERVAAPPGAPRVVLREGRPTLVIDGKIVPPFFFFGSCPDEARVKTILDEIRKASQSGVHVHSLLIDFVVDAEGAQQALDLTAYLLRSVLEVDADARVILRVVFAGGKGWDKKYPKASFRYADGSLAEPSICDDDFWGEAARLLAGYVKALRSLDSGASVLGIHLDRGEWFFADGWGYDTSKAAEAAFRDWSIARYNGDRVLLQSALFDGSARFETLRIPDYDEYPLSGEGFLRARRKERKWVDYHLFLSDAIVERIQSLAWEVKKASEGWFLVAVSYGYTFEWSHPANGHLALGKLLRTREIDIVAGPPSYRDRDLGGTAALPGPIDSIALNGKLFISEEDFKTPIGRVVEPDEFNPPMQTPQALEAAHWRGVGAALAHESGISWMDLWGNGWLNTPNIWARAAQVREILIKAMSVPERDPDVAVLIDERSLSYLSDARAFRQLVQDSREAVLRAGVSAGFYLLSDLAHRKRFPDAKLYIFLNAWDMRAEVRAAIKSRLQRQGKTLFWVYSAGLFEAGRPALERVREVTGIAIRPQPFNSKAGTTILNRKHPLTELLEERALSVVEQLEPSYFAIPEDGTTILGEYTQTGLPSFVVRDIPVEQDGGGMWRSVFLGEPLINEKLIRGLCALAGVHIWNYHGDVVHVRPPFLGIHYGGTGHRIATLPDRWHAYDPVKREMIGADALNLRSEASDGVSQLLFVGEEAEVHALSTLNADEFLNGAQVAEYEEEGPPDDTLEQDLPILKIPLAPEFSDLFSEDVEEQQAPSPEPKRRPRERKPRGPRKKKESTTPAKSDAAVGFTFREKG